MELIEPPRVEALPERPYLGIRTVTPFRGMLGVRDTLFDELRSWLADAEVETVGHGLFRLHVIDMNGPMDLEVGYLTRESLPGDGRVQPGVLPPAATRRSRQGSRAARQWRAHRIGRTTTSSRSTGATSVKATSSCAATRRTEPTRRSAAQDEVGSRARDQARRLSGRVSSCSRTRRPSGRTRSRRP